MARPRWTPEHVAAGCGTVSSGSELRGRCWVGSIQTFQAGTFSLDVSVKEAPALQRQKLYQTFILGPQSVFLSVVNKLSILVTVGGWGAMLLWSNGSTLLNLCFYERCLKQMCWMSAITASVIKVG